MKKSKGICNNCEYWIPLIDSGQCNINSKVFCEHNDTCDKYEKLSYLKEMLRKYGRNN